MADREHIEILKQGVAIWNKWRKNNPTVAPNLSLANFSDANLSDANLSDTNLWGANLKRTQLNNTNLKNADLSHTKLNNADLRYADLNYAKLNRADFKNAYVRNANLSYADLSYVDLSYADLNDANLRYADLDHANLRYGNLNNANLNNANFSDADLSDADLSDADFGGTIFRFTKLSHTKLNRTICHSTTFVNLDFSTAKGLNTVIHYSPSTLGIDTIFKSKGKIPEIFLRGCGLPDILIKYLPSMMDDAIQFYSCFISYSHADKDFARLLHDRLQGQGIRCWLDEHQLNPGDKLHPTIYEAIRVYDKVILCCSEKSLTSWWVEKEFENMIAKEEDFEETLLIPVALDTYLFDQSANDWLIGEIRKKRFVQDFKGWENHSVFETAFTKVVKALRTDGGKLPDPPSKLTPRK